FSIYCYGYHRHLHSFPTRRSSDLRQKLHKHHAKNRDKYYHAYYKNREKSYRKYIKDHGKRYRDHDAWYYNKRFHNRKGYVYFPEDRKSTRLNSSHVKISYAVFCLK